MNRRVAVVGLAGLALLSVVMLHLGESSGTGAPTGSGRYTDYVALGDSYTAAPYVPVTDLATDCLRSTNNYPHLVARALHVAHLEDRSCTGATTADTTGSQATHLGPVPPQFTGLDDRTDLVTVSLGYNDGHLYHRLATACRNIPGYCRLYDQRGLLDTLVERIGPALVQTLTGVRARAPHARILLVGYPDIPPPVGTCAKLPLYRPQDVATLRDVDARLRQQMRRAAQEVGVEFVDVYTASLAHDVCARHPWVQGRLGDRHVAAALHPLASGQRAVARLVEQRLRTPSTVG